ncbi:MAG: HAD-IIB family hydrolase [Nitratireductor sp.]|nr:HAD-IIB family hydrolase [Nitratireductor sp.]
MARLILFTDLDGTLLDHETYSCAPALPVLERLAGLGVPVVLASSKTATEIAALQNELGLSQWPAIVENGAGIVWPHAEGAVDEGGDMHVRIRAALDGMDPVMRSRFSGFSDWSVEEVARRTGLSLDAAARARQRKFSEPGVFAGDPGERGAFIKTLRALGLDARMGGRFLTISQGATKAGRMAGVVERLGGDETAMTVALGDALNDVEMLEAADLGVVVANPSHAPLPALRGEDDGRIIRTVLPGPAGWAQAVGDILDRQG